MYPSNEDKQSGSESTAREWAKALEDREVKRLGVALPDARRSVARRIGVAPGCLENLRRGRLKGVRVWVFERIRAAFMRECEAEIKRLTHDLEIARMAGTDAHKNQTGEIEAHLDALWRLMND